MKYSILYLLICCLLFSCSDKMKFSREIWFKKDDFIGIDNRRDKMVDDIIDSLLIKRPTYSEIIDSLGEPRNVYPLYSTISYNVFVRIVECPMYNDADMKFLDLKFDKDSVISEIRLREYGLIKKKYILDDLK